MSEVDQAGRPTILPLVVEKVCFEAGGKRLIDGITFTVAPGTRAVVLGPNGAGKSLLLRLCHGLIQPSAGRVVWAGAGSQMAHRQQAMVFQRPVLLRRSAAANITYALSVHGVPRRERKRLVAEALELAGLSPLAQRSARVLSGGEQQRLALARAWALKPQVLFLDEPTANLDPAATYAVEALLDRIHRAGTTVIMTTHDLGQARRLADDVLFLHHGRLVEHAPAASFFAQPQSAEAAAFLAGRLLW
ncbi:MAG TPA: phosphate ABC transporter ATP-binding protein [Alphaproteobacteria bacterium]|nr:phosphate ABC transporter ATP-binding protein [Alphaproteobacteria bacterium]